MNSSNAFRAGPGDAFRAHSGMPVDNSLALFEEFQDQSNLEKLW